MRVSFDYDGTLLDHKSIQNLAKMLVESGNDVYVITSRSPLRHDPYFKTLISSLGIRSENVFFVDNNPKVNKIKELCIDMHFDDIDDEIKEILRHYPKCTGLLVGRDWEDF